jgi:hypothetical protein
VRDSITSFVVMIFSDSQFRIVFDVSLRDEYEALFGKGTGPLILARTDSLVTDGFGKLYCYDTHHVKIRSDKYCAANIFTN